MLTPAQIDARRVREALHYNPMTGIFLRKANKGGQKIGAEAGTSYKGRRTIMVDGHRYYANVLAWVYVYGEWPSGLVDHKNNDPSDNRIENLRIANRQQNRANARVQSDNLTGLKGVGVHRSGKFQASLRVAGRRIYLGLFRNKEDAHAAYIRAASEAFGEFTRDR